MNDSEIKINSSTVCSNLLSNPQNMFYIKQG